MIRSPFRAFFNRARLGALCRVSSDSNPQILAHHRIRTMYSYCLESGNGIVDRTSLSKSQIIEDIWRHLNLPETALGSVALPGTGHIYKSSYRIADLAQASIALSALSAALVFSTHHNKPLPKVSVDRCHAALEFASERLYSVDGKPSESAWGPLSGLHLARDGYVRLHDGFSNLSKAALDILGLPIDASRAEVSQKIREWKADELEKSAMERKAVIYRLRTYEEWDATPQAKAVKDFPMSIRKLREHGGGGTPEHMLKGKDRCLRGLRVLDLSRVIAAPVAGRTLAAHGADVLWITSPSLPDIPSVDKDVNRGKKTVHLDLNSLEDVTKLEELIKETDVLIQAYRPGALAAKGITSQRLAELRPGIVVAHLSAWGDEGPWAENRGFDSIVQTVSGLNHSEWQHSGESSTPAKPLPVQALDHAAGYFLATGISAALCKRTTQGGSWEVTVSLAATMKYLRSLGQLSGNLGFQGDTKTPEEHLTEAVKSGREEGHLEEKMSGFGPMKAVTHSARVEGLVPGFDVMPKLRGSDKPEWS